MTDVAGTEMAAFDAEVVTEDGDDNARRIAEGQVIGWQTMLAEYEAQLSAAESEAHRQCAQENIDDARTNLAAAEAAFAAAYPEGA